MIDVSPLVAFMYAQDNISDAEQKLSDLPAEILTKLNQIHMLLFEIQEYLIDNSNICI